MSYDFGYKQRFFVAGGKDPKSVFSGFDKGLLATSFNVIFLLKQILMIPFLHTPHLIFFVTKEMVFFNLPYKIGIFF